MIRQKSDRGGERPRLGEEQVEAICLRLLRIATVHLGERRIAVVDNDGAILNLADLPRDAVSETEWLLARHAAGKHTENKEAASAFPLKAT